jgi:azurin
MRVTMEKVNGVYQGASFPFIEGFSSGIIRMIWGSDSNMFVGMTSRGWSSTGNAEYGLQRLVWTGKIPFEIKTIKAENDGFTVEFTKPINKELAGNTGSYKVSTFNYEYHNTYGSDIVNQQMAMVHGAAVSDDGMSVKLTVHGMKLGFIHQLKAAGIMAADGEPLLHDTGYYTLNEVPGGELKSPQMHKMSKSGKMIHQPKRTNEIPLNWSNGPNKVIEVGTVPGLKFDFKEIRVKAKTRIQLTLNNNDDMLHNLVIIKPGDENADKIGQMALELGLDGPDMNFVPDSDLIMYHTGIVQPETSETIYFQAPKTRGEYWVLCTFPGHSYTMRAKLIIEK